MKFKLTTHGIENFTLLVLITLNLTWGGHGLNYFLAGALSTRLFYEVIEWIKDWIQYWNAVRKSKCHQCDNIEE